MSTRERWIIYPLLLMTLGIAMRDKIFVPTRLRAGELAADKIVCNRFQAAHAACSESESIKSECRQLQASQIVCGEFESIQAECRALLVRNPKGQRIVAIGAEAKTLGGTIETFAASGAPTLRIPAPAPSRKPEPEKATP
jgi:hypothetical protein